MSRSWAVAAVVTLFVVPAAADTKSRPANWRGTTHVVVDTPVDQFTPHAAISPYLYVNRCTGGCQINGGTLNDARTNTSTIPATGPHTISEFKNDQGMTGAAADAEWNQILQCMREVYSPFAVQVVDQRPTTGVSYTMAIIAGYSSEIGLDPSIFGIAPLAGDCSPQDNVISFSFANQHPNNERVFNVCWTAAQESAHAFGLDHEFLFADGTSACNDPMTYRVDCGGEKFFRNKSAQCGEESTRPCRCGGQQNSHQKIRSVFGDGMSIIPAPTCTIEAPIVSGATISNSSAIPVQAGSKRGVEKVELWLGKAPDKMFKWATAAGAMFGAAGQPNPSGYAIPMPMGVPDGNIDIIVKAYDDLLLETDSQTISVSKGAPCASAMTCAKGQKCEAGYCFWDAPTGEIGDTCAYPQFCKTGICADAVSGDDFCSQNCIVGATDACPMGFECIAGGGTMGLCAPLDKGGCCSVGTDGKVATLMSMFVLGLMLRRRRR